MTFISKETPIIKVEVSNNKPKIIFTNNYILTYYLYSIILYDLNGNYLDENKDFTHNNKEIYKINDNKFVSFYKNFVFKIEIISNKIEKTIIKIFDSGISSISYIKENNIILVQFDNYFQVMDMDNLNIIDTINTINCGFVNIKFFNFNKDIFILYDERKNSFFI